MIKREDIKVGLKFYLPTAVSDKPSMVCINVELYNGKIVTLEKHNNVVFTVEGVANFFDSGLCYISYNDTDGGSVKVNYHLVSLDYIMKNGEKAVSSQKESELRRDDDKDFFLLYKSEAESIAMRLKADGSTFRDITDEMYDTYKAKNKDYDDSFHQLFEECGMTYAYGHLKEKLVRMKSLMKDEAKVKGESMRDSLLDLANYAILTIMELDKTKK